MRLQAQREAIASENTDSSNLEQEWEVEGIMGEEKKDGKLYYLVKWAPTLVSEDDMRNAIEAVRDWQKTKSKIRAKAKRALGRKGTTCANGVKGAKA